MHHYRLTIALLSLAFACGPLLGTDAPTIYHAIEVQHRRSFPPNNQQPWDESSFYKYVMRYFSEQKQPTWVKKRALAFDLLKSKPETVELRTAFECLYQLPRTGK